MLGIWFNFSDLIFSRKPHIDYECLKLLGFTDAYVLIKGRGFDHRSRPEYRAELDRLFEELHRQDIRTHGVFYCSDDRNYVEMYPDRSDITILGNRSKRKISHLDSNYVDYLVDSITTAVQEYELNGIQFDFVRYGVIGNGWGPEEEAIYSSFGVDVSKLKNDLLAKYDESKPRCNVDSILNRYAERDEQLIALASGRRSVICGFLRTLTDRIRVVLPGRELSVTMMPEAFYSPWKLNSVLHYGQAVEDFYPWIDRVVPMVYSGIFGMNDKWVETIVRTVAEQYPGSIIGLDSVQPRTGINVQSDMNIIHGLENAGVCIFRYGRMIFEAKDGKDTLLYNTYPGTVTRLVLRRGADEHTQDCELEEASWLRITGHWDEIRAFGAFDADDPPHYDGELCVLKGDSLL